MLGRQRRLPDMPIHLRSQEEPPSHIAGRHRHAFRCVTRKYSGCLEAIYGFRHTGARGCTRGILMENALLPTPCSAPAFLHTLLNRTALQNMDVKNSSQRHVIYCQKIECIFLACSIRLVSYSLPSLVEVQTYITWIWFHNNTIFYLYFITCKYPKDSSAI